jgi:hypothetical protein
MEPSIEQLKVILAATLADVEGWLDVQTAWMLHELARRFPASCAEITVVEIGCWKGRSTIALALGLKARGGGKVYAIDPHTGSEQTIWECGAVDTYDAFVNNITKSQLTEFVEPVRTTSHLARGRFPDNFAHLLIVDASRDESAVLEYIDDWSTALADAAIVGFRDPFDIYRVLRQRMLRFRSPFRNPIFIEDSHGPILLLELQTQRPWRIQDAVSLLLLAMQHRIHVLRRCEAFEEHMPQWVDSMLGAINRAVAKIVIVTGHSETLCKAGE